MRRSTHYVSSTQDLSRPGNVYFISCDNRFVKVGFALELETRLADLQTACPFELKPIGVLRHTSMRAEQWFHGALREERVRGEWFNLTERVRLLIQFVNDGFYPANADEVEFLFAGIDRPGVAEIAARFCRIRKGDERDKPLNEPSAALAEVFDRVALRRSSAL